MIGRYVVENMLPLSTVDIDSFRALFGKILGRAGAGPVSIVSFMLSPLCVSLSGCVLIQGQHPSDCVF